MHFMYSQFLLVIETKWMGDISGLLRRLEIMHAHIHMHSIISGFPDIFLTHENDNLLWGTFYIIYIS